MPRAEVPEISPGIRTSINIFLMRGLFCAIMRPATCNSSRQSFSPLSIYMAVLDGFC
jgi:hypothetical protein